MGMGCVSATVDMGFFRSALRCLAAVERRGLLLIEDLEVLRFREFVDPDLDIVVNHTGDRNRLLVAVGVRCLADNRRGEGQL